MSDSDPLVEDFNETRTNNNVSVTDKDDSFVDVSVKNISALGESLSSRNRISISEEDLENLSIEELRTKWKQQDCYLDLIEKQRNDFEVIINSSKELEEKLKNQISEQLIRERMLIRRLAVKEQEIQEYSNQLNEFKSNQFGGVASLRNTLVDPAVNILIKKLRKELADTKLKLEDTQNELTAWKFTPDSNTGKRLMAKCRLLYQENEELGKMISSGKLAKLEGELALQKSFSEEVKKSQSELDELLQELDEDVEGMQSTIYYLQQELRKSKEHISNLENELESNFKKQSSNTVKTLFCQESDVDNDMEENGLKNGDISSPERTTVISSKRSAAVSDDVNSCNGNGVNSTNKRSKPCSPQSLSPNGDT